MLSGPYAFDSKISISGPMDTFIAGVAKPSAA